MNNDDPFEQRFRRQPLRQVPPAWREEILSQARAAAWVNRQTTPIRELTFAAALRLRLRELLWPCPQAWAGLAAVWVVILVASFATREPAPVIEARQAVPLTPAMRQMLREQRLMLAELRGGVERFGGGEARPVAPQPRSERRQELGNT